MMTDIEYSRNDWESSSATLMGLMESLDIGKVGQARESALAETKRLRTRKAAGDSWRRIILRL